MATTSSPPGNFAYTTLITRASYLAGVIVLAHTLRKHGSQYPLLVYHTPNLSAPALRALELEAPHLNLILRPCPPLLPPSNIRVNLIAERFGDTWTKLRVFDCTSYDTVCYLDADMAIFNTNMDLLFTSARAQDLPPDHIAANHACVCNLDSDPWAPTDWTAQNCAYTPLSHPSALTHPTEVHPTSRPTHHLLNSGMFLYHPSPSLWDSMLSFFNTTPLLAEYKFPDQDFLADFFRNKWRSLGWQYNALKTMRYWHENIWRDEEVVCLHYIVDKPWAARVSADGRAGYKGRDGETHGWWWREYEGWVTQRREEGGEEGEEVVGLVGKYVARSDGLDGDDPDMRAIGSGVQAFANNKADGEGKEGDSQGADGEDKKEGTKYGMFKNKALGEHGHGPRAKS